MSCPHSAVSPTGHSGKKACSILPCDTVRALVTNLAMVPKDGGFQASTEGRELGVGTVEELNR